MTYWQLALILAAYCAICVPVVCWFGGALHDHRQKQQRPAPSPYDDDLEFDTDPWFDAYVNAWTEDGEPITVEHPARAAERILRGDES